MKLRIDIGVLQDNVGLDRLSCVYNMLFCKGIDVCAMQSSTNLYVAADAAFKKQIQRQIAISRWVFSLSSYHLSFDLIWLKINLNVDYCQDKHKKIGEKF